MAEAVTDYDVIIIGGGRVAVPLAAALSAAGMHVAVVERKRLGGSHVNFGPTPTKAAQASARLVYQARRAEAFGLRIPAVEVDLEAVLEAAEVCALQQYDEEMARLRELPGVDLLSGHGRLTGKRGRALLVSADGRRLRADQVVIDTGSRSSLPPLEGLGTVPYVHAGNWLGLRSLPEHLVMVGGGFVGLEMGQFYRRLGAQVTVLHRGDHVLPKEDADVAAALQRLLEDEGMRFELRAEATAVECREDGVRLHYEQRGRMKTVSGSHLFVAAGRKPNTDDLGLETVGLAPNEEGFIEVDETLKAKVPGLWVAGDARSGPSYAHSAYDDHRVIAARLTRASLRTAEQVVPYAVFTDPELGRVGMTEYEARRTGQKVEVVVYDMARSRRASELRETRGFIKLVVNGATKQVLGAAVLAYRGAELVHSYLDLINAGLPYRLIGDAIYIHPTLQEAVQGAVAMLEP
jgi:pyruvate/2-oxoglutarate dehydrogenase complex dihydrolipoamide dehydrogenase (E3) component